MKHGNLMDTKTLGMAAGYDEDKAVKAVNKHYWLGNIQRAGKIAGRSMWHKDMVDVLKQHKRKFKE